MAGEPNPGRLRGMSEPDGRADAFASAWKDEDAPEDVVAHSLLCLSVAEAHRDRHAEETARRDSFLARIGTRRPADFGSWSLTSSGAC